ncbi:MAG: carboxypeptidase regulatory-like domain-containing protein, partial [Acidobacteria bacterium]|nr:carboxypeptidase regulatory-like domain-containing protein [Acidobacteriota bacterium]
MLALFAATPLFGQGELATITGVVTDSSKAVMAGVVVTVRNTETNQIRTVPTAEDGYFTLAQLVPGSYELTALKPGFRTYRQPDIVLETGQQLRADIELQLGAVSETVEVTASVAPLNTENGQIKGAVVVQQEIQDVPLDGRDFTDIAFLVPGVLPKAQGGQGSAMAINGSRADNTNFYVDGFNDRNARGAAAQLRPNIDALQEFKMEVSGFSAQYGKMAGGVMNMVLKSGTNRLHGSAFEYLRNDLVDARSFFDPVKYPLRRNQFGGVLSGPAVFPKLYDGRDRTFFLLSFEAYRQRDGQTRLSNVPTALQRAGDFTGIRNSSGKVVQIKDPLNKNAVFPGLTIPVSRFSPAAVNVMKYYPLPNYAGIGLNYQASGIDWEDWESVLWKIDHRLSDRDQFSVRYGYRWNPHNEPWDATDVGGFAAILNDNRSLGGLTWTHMFSPVVINELRVGFSRTSQHEHIDTSEVMPTAAELGMAGSTDDPMLAGFPKVNITNYADLGFAANQPLNYFVTDYQLGNDLTRIRGRHALKFGVGVSRGQFNQPYFNNSRGTFTANGVWTGGGTAANGDAFADFLLGLLNASTITAQPTRCYLRWTDLGAYVNDDFRITRSLTLNLGMRYEAGGHPHEKYGRLMNFVPEYNKLFIASDRTIPNLAQLAATAGLTGRVALGSEAGLPDTLVFPDRNNFAPRVGFAWRPLGGTRLVVRGGYGWFYAGTVLNPIRDTLATSFPFSTDLSFNRVSSNVNALTLANPWPRELATLAGTNTSNGFQLHAPTAYMQNYNLTIERDLGRGDVLEVSYVGSKGTHLGRRYNVNLPLRSIAWYMANGTTFPVPYPPLGTINYDEFGSNPIYSAGQIMFRRRGTGGFFYRVSYTYSKSIDNASQYTGSSDGGISGALDPRNLRLDRGRSDFDRGHVFTAIFTWPLPVGRGRRLPLNGNRVVSAMFGGWQLSGTTTAYTGQPFTIQDSSINANQGESTRPNRIAKGTGVTGQGRRGLDYPWYEPTAFVDAPRCA